VQEIAAKENKDMGSPRLQEQIGINEKVIGWDLL